YGGSSEAFPLLNRGAGARPAAMGSAFEALADDASGPLYNPAGLGFAREWDLGFHHDSWLASSSRENFGAAGPMGSLGGFALNAAYVNYPSVDMRDSQGAKLGEFKPVDQALGFAWGKNYSPGFS